MTNVFVIQPFVCALNVLALHYKLILVQSIKRIADATLYRVASGFCLRGPKLCE